MIHCPTCSCNSSGAYLQQSETLGGIDDQINSLRTELKLLCTYRNERVSVNRLPQEILLQIFHTLPHPHGNSFAVLTNITSVCSYWRNLAIGDPALWTNISTNHPKAIQCMLERSRSLPFSASIDIRQHPTHNLDILNHVFRIQSLSLDAAYGSDMADVMSTLASSFTPLLRELTLRCHLATQTQPIHCLAPHLSTLSLLNMALPLSPASYSKNLRQFVFHRDAFDHRSLTLTQWLDLFTEMTALEEIDLKYPLNVSDDSVLTEERVVSFNRLTRFTMFEAIADAGSILRRISFPSQAQVTLISLLILGDIQSTSEALDLFASILYPHIQPLSGSYPLHALLISSHDMLSAIQGYEHLQSSITFGFLSDCTSTWPSPRMRVGFVDSEGSSDTSAHEAVCAMQSIISDLPMRELVVDGVRPSGLISALEDNDWAKSLVFVGALFPRCVNALYTLSLEDRVRLLSNVRTIVFRGVPFHWAEVSYVEEILDKTEIIEVRIETSTGVTEEKIDMLRRKVDNVMWDGRLEQTEIGT